MKITGQRLNPRVVVNERSPNVSERSTSISLIVLHSTESANAAGDKDLQAIADWFANPIAEVSAHVVVDGDGNSARCVPDVLKAWACVEYNSPSLNIEQIGHAAQTSWGEAECEETARWIAHWSKAHRIPIRRAWVAGGRVLRSGVTTHRKLGAAGGGHTDPGEHYPMEHVLRLAREFKRHL